MPLDSYMSTFETNIYAAQALFWSKSYNWQYADYRDYTNEELDTEVDYEEFLTALKQDQYVDEDIAKSCMKEYHRRMNPTIGCQACGCCGISDIPMNDCNELEKSSDDILYFHMVSILDERLEILRYTQEEYNHYTSDIPHDQIEDTEENRYRWERYKLSIAIVEKQIDEQRSYFYHLYNELYDIENDLVLICDVCMKSLSKHKVPNISVKNGWDLGMPDKVNNPPLRKLSFIEEFVLQRVRVLSSAINITLNRPKGQYNVFHGHCICFEDNAAAICGNQLPDINFIDNSIKITIEGPAKAVNSIYLEQKLRNLKCISISATSVLDWLYFLKFMNPYYYDIVIKNPIDIQNDMNNLLNSLINNRISIPWVDDKDETKLAQETADITRIDESLLEKSTNKDDNDDYILQLQPRLDDNVLDGTEKLAFIIIRKWK